MRRCARMGCPSDPAATITLRYADRLIVIGELVPERDPNLLELCADHLGRMTPPVGWLVDDTRLEALAADRG